MREREQFLSDRNRKTCMAVYAWSFAALTIFGCSLLIWSAIGLSIAVACSFSDLLLIASLGATSSIAIGTSVGYCCSKAQSAFLDRQ